MACLNCVACLGYDGDGLFGADLDPDGNIVCNAAGELTLGVDADVLSDDIPVDPDIIEDCVNGISKVGSRLWMPPTPSGGCFKDSATGFVGPTDIGFNSVLFTPVKTLTLPEADECLDTTYMIAVKRWIRFDQTGGSDYNIIDNVNNVDGPYPTAVRYTIPGNRHNTMHYAGWMHCVTRPAGAGPFDLDFRIRVRTLANDLNYTDSFVYSYGFQWDGIKIAMGT